MKALALIASLLASAALIWYAGGREATEATRNAVDYHQAQIAGTVALVDAHQ